MSAAEAAVLAWSLRGVVIFSWPTSPHCTTIKTSVGELIPSATKPCHDDDAAAVAEEAMGAGSRLRTVPHLLSHQHTKTGTQTTYMH